MSTDAPEKHCRETRLSTAELDFLEEITALGITIVYLARSLDPYIKDPDELGIVVYIVQKGLKIRAAAIAEKKRRKDEKRNGIG